MQAATMEFGPTQMGEAQPVDVDHAGDEARQDAAFRSLEKRRRFDRAEALLDGWLPLDAAVAIAEGSAEIALGDGAARSMALAHDRMRRCIDEGRVVYGVTTGFGPLADRLVSPADIETLQRHLVYHLASGVGAPMNWSAARATVLARLASMACGWSGVSAATADLLVALLNSPYAPRIPEKGTVGASGDLTPLAHVALALMGEGGFIDRAGRAVDPLEAFAAMGRAPLTLEARDGLALVNGTSAMTGVALMNGALAERLLDWSEALTVGYAELLRGRTEAWRAEFSEARPHPGQTRSAATLRALSEGSSRLETRLAAERMLSDAMRVSGAAQRDGRALQDPYSVRCAPQVLGAARDVLSFHQSIVLRELNAATDNPIFADGDAPALHGGNFMGCHVAQASDALANAVVMLSGFAERQIARLTDETRNGDLPAFLHRGPSGLNSGFMGAQVTATALLAEMRARSGAASIHSISTNADNQDVVSLGTIAARGAADALTGLSEILAIQALAVVQGVEIVGLSERTPAADNRRDIDHPGFSSATRAVGAWIRRRAAPLDRDRPLSEDIQTVAAALRRSGPPV